MNRIEQAIYPFDQLISLFKQDTSRVFIVGTVSKFKQLLEKVIADSKIFAPNTFNSSFLDKYMSEQLEYISRYLTLEVVGKLRMKNIVLTPITNHVVPEYIDKFLVSYKTDDYFAHRLQLQQVPIEMAEALPSIDTTDLDQYLDASINSKQSPIVASVEDLKIKIQEQIKRPPHAIYSPWYCDWIKKLWYVELCYEFPLKDAFQAFYKCANIIDPLPCIICDPNTFFKQGMSELLKLTGFKGDIMPLNYSYVAGDHYLFGKVLLRIDEFQVCNDYPLDTNLSHDIIQAFKESRYFDHSWIDITEASKITSADDNINCYTLRVFKRREHIIVEVELLTAPAPAGVSRGGLGHKRHYLTEKDSSTWKFIDDKEIES